MRRVKEKESAISSLRHIAKSHKWRTETGNADIYVPSNKNKIRGWKRKANALNDWGNAIQLPYLKYWNNGSNYMDAGYKAYPWYGFYGYRHPPIWFLKTLLQHLVCAYDKWNQVLKERNEPFDLFIELHDPNYILTELSCKRTDAFGIETYYWPPSEKQKPFPHNKFALKNYDITVFDWKLCDEEDYVFEDDVYWRNTTIEKLLSKGYYKTQTAKGETYYAKKTGEVWIGRKTNVTGITPVTQRRYPFPPP
jgi:hypothetical protein